MNPNQVQQAYAMLAQLEAQASQLQKNIATVVQLLQVPQQQQAVPMGMQQAAVPAEVAVAGQTKAELALWDKGMSSTGNAQCGGYLTLNGTIKHSVMMFASNPNSNGLVFNGYILPADGDRDTPLQDKKLGGLFIYQTQQGLVCNVAYDDSPLVAEGKFSIPIAPNPQKQPGDSKPGIVGRITLPFVVIKEAAQVAQQAVPQQDMFQQQVTQQQQPQANMFAQHGAPADPNNINNILGIGQQPGNLLS